MCFKVHHVKEVYSDLWKYGDSRDQLSQFRILKPQTIEYHFMVQCPCNNHGYKGSVELYYLPPLSEPATGLVRITREEDVKKMMTVHAEQGPGIVIST